MEPSFYATQMDCIWCSGGGKGWVAEVADGPPPQR
jgi:hypothetical protein